MTVPPTEIDIREEIDVVSLDPAFLERQRNRYASRGVAYVVWLNGLAAIALLVSLLHGNLPAENVKAFADAMLVFGAGAAAGLTSAFFAYLGREPINTPWMAWGSPLWSRKRPFLRGARHFRNVPNCRSRIRCRYC